MTTSKSKLKFLSKSLFVRGRQCHKALYLAKHFPDLKDEACIEREVKFSQGHKVGEAALALFPDGCFISFDGVSLAEQVAMTDKALAEHNSIYEAAFLSNDTFVKVDILNRDGEGWDIYEVKSSTKAKDVYLLDVALQYHVAKEAGLPVSRVFITVLNKAYTYRNNLDVKRLFRNVDVTEKCMAMEPQIKADLAEMREMLHGPIPERSIGKHCKEPYTCDYFNHCWMGLPEKNVFTVKGNGFPKYELFEQGIVHLKDVPLEKVRDKQKAQITATIDEQNLVDQSALRAFLKDISYPVAHVDFESFQSALPLFDDTKPFQQIPFQFSVHIQERAGAQPQHYEFLAEPGKDPRRALLKELLAVLPVEGTVLAYNRSFEANIIRSLAGMYPEMKTESEAVVERMMDLMAPFAKRWVYFWQFHGAYSIKTVLPVLVPELSYENMAVDNGQAAAEAYHRMRELKSGIEYEKLRKELLGYCELDTFAMVQILEKLYTLAEATTRHSA